MCNHNNFYNKKCAWKDIPVILLLIWENGILLLPNIWV